MPAALLPSPVAKSAGAAPARSRALRPAGVEGITFAAVGLVVLWLHWSFFCNVGALWRDEANSVQLAALPTFAESWRWLPFDSFPAGFVLVLRAFFTLFAPTDVALRALGLAIGLAIAVALCWTGRQMGARWPLLSLALLGCNPLFIRYGDSVRAYGLGILLLLLALGAIWQVVERPSVGRWLVAATLGLLSVHAIFYNAVLLFALCLAGAAMVARQRAWRRGAVVLAVGLPAAASMLVYRPMIHEQHQWSFLVGYPVTLGWLWERLSDVTGSPNSLGVWLWVALVGGGLALAARPGRPAAQDDRVRFAALALVLSFACYAAFLKVLNYHTQPWYYISLLAPAALLLDVLFANALAGRWLRRAFAVAFTVFVALDANGELQTRQTNVDCLAAKLEKRAVEGDLIIFGRWECAITFHRYYHGKASLVTLPPIEDHRFHRYDLIKAQMMTPNPLAPVLARIAATLQAGRRIWYVGTPAALAPGETLPAGDPAWTGPNGEWHGAPYYQIWQVQTGSYLQEHVQGGSRVDVPVGQPVLPYENLGLYVFEGWKAN